MIRVHQSRSRRWPPCSGRRRCSWRPLHCPA